MEFDLNIELDYKVGVSYKLAASSKCNEAYHPDKYGRGFTIEHYPLTRP